MTNVRCHSTLRMGGFDSRRFTSQLRFRRPIEPMMYGHANLIAYRLVDFDRRTVSNPCETAPATDNVRWNETLSRPAGKA